MAEETETLSFTLTLPAGLTRRLEQALRADHLSLEQIVVQRLLFGRRGVRPRRLIPEHFFWEKEMKTLAFTVTAPPELAARIEPTLRADQITLERIALGWLLWGRGTGR
jgi:hypothetical protein